MLVAAHREVQAVRLGIVCRKLVVFIHKGTVQIQKLQAALIGHPGDLIVDALQAAVFQAGGFFGGLGLHGCECLHINYGVGQGLLQHIQHFSVICQKAIVVALCAKGVGAHQHIQFGRLALTQKIQRHLAAALGMLHGCAVHDLVGAAAHIAADQCPRHIDAVFSKAFCDRVAQECCIAEIAGAHLAALLAGDLLIANALQRAARVRAKLARLGRNRYKGAVFKRQRCQNAFPRRGGFGLFGRCFSFSPVNNTGDQRRKQKQQRQHQRNAKPPLRTAARTAKLGMVAVAVRLISHSDLSSPIFSECHFIIACLPE